MIIYSFFCQSERQSALSVVLRKDTGDVIVQLYSYSEYS